MRAANPMTETREPTDRSRRFKLLHGGAEGGAEDAGLVRSFLSGDDDALGQLFARHERLVLALVRRYATGPDDAADLLQRTFLRALVAARRSFELRHAEEIPFRAWLVRIAVNLGKNHQRDLARWRRAPVEAVDDSLHSPPIGTDELEKQERSRRLRDAVLKLPRRQRAVLQLRIDAELPFDEIAAVLGITANNAKVHFHHATRRLRELVGERREETP